MNKIIMCTGEEKSFDNDMTMFKSNKYNIEHFEMFEYNNIFHKVIRNFGSLFTIFEINKKLKNNIKNANVIIIFDSVVKNSFIKLIRKINPSIRIIIYFRNKFSTVKKRNINIEKLNKLNVEYWTYNLNDAKKFEFNYNNQFWNLNFLKKLSLNNAIKFDMVFLGRNKNRVEILNKLDAFCKKNYLKNFFYLVPYSNNDFDKNKNNEFLKYDKYLEIINSSNVIIDLVTQENYGLTLRPLESMFLQKKIITNYIQIKDYDFYDKNNVFIIGIDDENRLNDFIKSDFKQLNNEIMYKYTYDGWLDNFNMEGDFYAN